MALAVRYYFSQRFAVSAQRAFEWCIDFDPKDHSLMGDANAKRQISHITEDTIILTDVFLFVIRHFRKAKARTTLSKPTILDVNAFNRSKQVLTISIQNYCRG